MAKTNGRKVVEMIQQLEEEINRNLSEGAVADEKGDKVRVEELMRSLKRIRTAKAAMANLELQDLAN